MKNQTAVYQIIDRSQMQFRLNLVANCQDCACAEPVPRLPQPPTLTREKVPAGVNYRQPAGLRLRPLTAGYWTAFNPSGEAGVIVLNRQAYQLLEHFSKPRSLASLGDKQPFGLARETHNALHKLLSLGLLHRSDQPKPTVVIEEKVLTVWLHVTNQCNLRCTYCYLQKTNETMSRATGRAAVDAVIRAALAERYPVIKLKYAGGEAALQMARVFEIHDYAADQCRANGLALRAVLLSNGTTLTPSKIEGLKQRQIKVMVSLDGLGKVHDIQRPYLGGQASVRRVMHDIEQLIKQGLPPHLSITITAQNCDTIDQVVRFALVRNLTFSLNFYRETAYAATPEQLRFSESQMIEGVQAAYRAIEENLPPWSVVGAVLDRGHLISPHERACGVGQDYLVIDHHGQISKCNMEMDKVVGDISHPNPVQLIQGAAEGVQNLPSSEKEGCRTCEWRYWCTGGCPVVTYRATGRYDIKSPNCSIYQAIYPQAVRLEGLRLLRYASQTGDLPDDTPRPRAEGQRRQDA